MNKRDLVESVASELGAPRVAAERAVKAVLDGILEGVERALEGRRTPNWTITPDHPLHQRLAQLIPWNLVRVQAAKLPKARRIPDD